VRPPAALASPDRDALPFDGGCEGRIEVTSAGQSDRACQYRRFMPSDARKCLGVRAWS